MSERLDHLYEAAHREGQGVDATIEAWRAYRAYAVALAEGLPFTYRLVGIKPTRYTTETTAIHIAIAEDVTLGKLQRHPGDALCRPRWQFSGGLGGLNELVASEDGATCVKCLTVAEAHSTIKRQAS